MIRFRKSISALIGFDRREKCGTLILSAGVVVLLIVRLTLFRPGEVPDELPPLPAMMAEKDSVDTPEAVTFSFDPNTVSFDDLLKLGLTERQARTMLNYRNSGARFRRPEDLARVYGIDSATKARLIPYVILGKTADAGGFSSSRKPADRGREGSDASRAIRQGVVTDGARQGYVSNGVRQAPDYRETGSAFSPDAPVDINTCTAEELVSLPGIGPVLSVRIVRYRSLLGGFVEKGQLEEVYGLDSSVVRLIEERLTLTWDSVRMLQLDSVTFGDMARHPYLGYEAARRITRYRSVAPPPVTLGRMVAAGVITPEQASRIAPYVRPPQGATGSDYEFISLKVLK